MTYITDTLTQWLSLATEFIGYREIAIAMFLEAFILPFPAEPLLLIAGYRVAGGELSFVGVVAAGLVGSWLGSMGNYALGRYLGKPALDMIIKWCGVKQSVYDKAEAMFLAGANKFTFWGRFIPGVRSVVSIPPGVFRMNLVSFSLYSSLAALILIVGVVGLGALGGRAMAQGLVYQLEWLLAGIALLVLMVASVLWWHKRHIKPNIPTSNTISQATNTKSLQ
jgi:membrane protein DedA with SNARE-associated domain